MKIEIVKQKRLTGEGLSRRFVFVEGAHTATFRQGRGLRLVLVYPDGARILKPGERGACYTSKAGGANTLLDVFGRALLDGAVESPDVRKAKKSEADAKRRAITAQQDAADKLQRAAPALAAALAPLAAWIDWLVPEDGNGKVMLSCYRHSITAGDIRRAHAAMVEAGVAVP